MRCPALACVFASQVLLHVKPGWLQNAIWVCFVPVGYVVLVACRLYFRYKGMMYISTTGPAVLTTLA
jgi:hypothetical protein